MTGAPGRRGPRRTGRRPGDSGARAAIVDAARTAFSEVGYEGATMRGIAREAGVDPALIHHYFGTKDELFAATMRLPMDPDEFVPRLVAEGTDGLGERLVRLVLGVWESPGEASQFLALIRSAVRHERSAAMLRDFVSVRVLGRLVEELGVDEGPRRAALAGSELMGLAMSRYVIRVEPLASADVDSVARPVGAAVQRYLTEPLP